MDLPVLNGVIDRRILINYRVNPEVVKSLLPVHLEPLVINGYASAGICLLRLKGVGVKSLPGIFRIASENAAHRFLIKYQKGNKTEQGVYIPRRDTDSMLNVALAGRLFSWPHYSARFSVEERDGNYAVKMQSKDLQTSLQVAAQVTDRFPSDSMFDSLAHASACFCECCVGISPSTKKDQFKTIRLKTSSWDVKPLMIQELHSSYFENTSLFPEGSITFDHALVMEGIEHEWVTDDNRPQK